MITKLNEFRKLLNENTVKVTWICSDCKHTNISNVPVQKEPNTMSVHACGKCGGGSTVKIPTNEELSVGPHGLEEENEWVVFRVDTAGFDYYILPADTVEDHSEYRHRDMFFGDEGVEYFDTHELAQAAVDQYEVDDFDADDDEESGEFEVEVSVRDAQKAIDIFNNGYRNLGIPSASNSFSFPLKSTYLDFINDLQQFNVEIISDILENVQDGPVDQSQFNTTSKMVIMSHLSDIQETHSGDKDLNNRINFIKTLLLKINDKTEINPETEWEEFTKTRFYRA